MVDTRSDEETIYHALVLGLRDYVTKNGFPSVVLGLSGGIDSGLTAAIAADALGAEKVHTIRLPSPFTSVDSMEDAEQLAAALHLRMDTVPITPLIDTARQTLAPLFAGRHADTTEENIQARLRGMLIMAVSNKFGAMVLTTGNKSEMSVGYATLYGDMCGGFSVLKDVYKTTVTRLARWRSAAPRCWRWRRASRALVSRSRPACCGGSTGRRPRGSPSCCRRRSRWRRRSTSCGCW